MTAVTAVDTWEVLPNAEVKKLIVTAPNTSDDGDTLAVTLANYGISATGLLYVKGWEHTTDGSVIVVANPTTSVSSGVLTMTFSGSNDNNFRVYEICGTASAGDFA